MCLKTTSIWMILSTYYQNFLFRKLIGKPKEEWQGELWQN